MDENQGKAQILTALASMFDFKFTEMVLMIYLKVLEDLSVDDLKQRITHGLKNNRWQFMPKPGEFLTIGDKVLLDDSRDAAHLCWGAIGQFGRCYPDKARLAMGSLAWTVVERMGGWNSICEVRVEEKGTFIAQFRDLAQSLSRKAERGEINSKPSLPQPSSLKALIASVGGSDVGRPI